MIKNARQNLQCEALMGDNLDAVGFSLENRYPGFCYIPAHVITEFDNDIRGTFSHPTFKDKREFAFIYNVNGNHWVLAYFNKPKKELFIIDSFKSKRSEAKVFEAAQKFIATYVDTKETRWTYRTGKKHASQTGVVDCGVYALAYLETILSRTHENYLFPQVTPDTIPMYREKFVSWIIDPETQTIRHELVYHQRHAKWVRVKTKTTAAQRATAILIE